MKRSILKISVGLFFLTLLSQTVQAGSEGPILRIAVRKKPLKVVKVPLERYVLGVLVNEVRRDWPLEALKAQAVASRSYALFRLRTPRSPTERYDLEASVQDQVFSRGRVYPSPLTQAVRETTGVTLRFDGEILPAFFHSSCGGMSERAASLWPEMTQTPVNAPHTDPFCEESPWRKWRYEISKSELGGEIQVLERDERGRVDGLLLLKPSGIEELTGHSLRARLGFNKIRSTLFEVEDDLEKVSFSGRGYGHGVGLCQWGAKGMAEKGFAFQEILQFYYPGAELATNEQKPVTGDFTKRSLLTSP